MPREHVEFVQSQSLPWQPADGLLARAGATIKILSREAITGAMSTLVRYPAGWSMTNSERLAADEELFVLDGELTIGDLRYIEGDYAFLPAGYPRRGMSAPDGCIVLTFFESRPSEHSGAAASYEESRLVRHVASSAVSWGSASDRVIANDRVRRLVLKPDAIDGDRTWLLQMDASEELPFEVNGIERHPCVEEMFLLDGDFVMACGRMTPGAYFWRPPMIAHGPMGTRRGFTGFFRAKEGSFSTVWADAEGPIDWDATYDPILPDDLRRQIDAASAMDESRW